MRYNNPTCFACKNASSGKKVIGIKNNNLVSQYDLKL